jgi:hypothetical protein
MVFGKMTGCCITLLAVSSLLLSACKQDPKAISTNEMQKNQSNQSSQAIAIELYGEFRLRHEYPFARFYSYEPQKDKLRDTADALESRYAYFQKKYGFESLDQVTVNLYPDYETMKSKLNWEPDVPVISGTVQGNKILIQAQSIENIRDLVIHEFTHYVLDKTGNQLPGWLNEGLATYEGIQMLDKVQADDRIYSKIKAHLVHNEPPSLGRMQPGKYSEFVEMKGYEFACSFVEYVIQEYGDDKMMEIVRKGTEWQKILGVSQVELEHRWHSHLKMMYGPR